MAAVSCTSYYLFVPAAPGYAPRPILEIHGNADKTIGYEAGTGQGSDSARGGKASAIAVRYDIVAPRRASSSHCAWALPRVSVCWCVCCRAARAATCAGVARNKTADVPRWPTTRLRFALLH